MSLTKGRECGDCTLCCTVMGVQELEKPAGVECEHACLGCKIYEERPPTCKEWSCMWKLGCFEDKHRPDKIGVIWSSDPGSDTTLHMLVDPHRPLAWRQAEGWDMLRALSTKFTVFIGGETLNAFVGPHLGMVYTKEANPQYFAGKQLSLLGIALLHQEDK